MSSVVERAHVVMLAASTSSPKLTDAGDYIFRLSPVSIGLGDILALKARKDGIERIAVIHEETDYATPAAERLRDQFVRLGGKVTVFTSFAPGETDFRAIATRVKSQNPDALYLGVQAQDTAILLVRQVRELGLNVQLLGNEVTGSAVVQFVGDKTIFDGLIFAEPEFHPELSPTKEFISRFESTFRTQGLPFGIWTAEAYDTVDLLAKTIAQCGDDAELVKACLYKVRNYDGVSGRVSINEKGDGVRQYVVKSVKDGRIVEPHES